MISLKPPTTSPEAEAVITIPTKPISTAELESDRPRRLSVTSSPPLLPTRGVVSSEIPSGRASDRGDDIAKGRMSPEPSTSQANVLEISQARPHHNDTVLVPEMATSNPKAPDTEPSGMVRARISKSEPFTKPYESKTKPEV